MEVLEKYIRQNVSFEELPLTVRQVIQNSKDDWAALVKEFSLQRQLRWSGAVISKVIEERPYYVELLAYSRRQLLIYPYHLIAVSRAFRRLRITPFKYYIDVMLDVARNEKSYDTLPNFTAADCVRILGIGRNQYIELMNKCRMKTSWTFKRRRTVSRDMLPSQPVPIPIEPWWRVHLAPFFEDDIRSCSRLEHEYIDLLMSKRKTVRSSELERDCVHSLYVRNLILLDVPVSPNDHVIIPPLEGFVMNRVSGDYFERLLYQIFVSIDESITVQQLAQILEVDVSAVQQGVSFYCRLGFAKIKEAADDNPLSWHPSWSDDSLGIIGGPSESRSRSPESLQSGALAAGGEGVSAGAGDVVVGEGDSSERGLEKRAAFVYDSTLTAFLMMGNLSPGLKTHAVTLFEVGKLPHESLPAFLTELANVVALGDEHTQRYSDHAMTLRDTLQNLLSFGLRLDMMRSESITTLDAKTRLRVLSHNYSMLIFMSPLSCETHPGVSFVPHLFGPAIPEMNSVWLKLFLYYTCQRGPPSILFARGTRVSRIPEMFRQSERLLVTQWESESTSIHTVALLSHLNELLLNGPVIVQAYSGLEEPEVFDVGFPIGDADDTVPPCPPMARQFVLQLQKEWNLDESFGFLRLVKIEKPVVRSAVGDGAADAAQVSLAEEWVPLELHFGIPLFSSAINEQIFVQIRARNSFGEENLRVHSKHQKRFCLALLDFIAKCQVSEIDLVDELGSADTGSRIYPSSSLCWDGERLIPFA